MMNTILNWHTPDNIVVTFIVEKKIRFFSPSYYSLLSCRYVEQTFSMKILIFASCRDISGRISGRMFASN